MFSYAEAVTSIIIKEERDTEEYDDNIEEVLPSSPDEELGTTEQSELTDISCPLCPDQFQDEEGMAKHLRDSHDIGNMYVCTVCQVICWSNKSFIQHMKGHQGQSENKRSDRRKQTPKKIQQEEMSSMLQDNMSALLQQSEANLVNIITTAGIKTEKRKKPKSSKGKKTKNTTSKKVTSSKSNRKKIKTEVKVENDDLVDDEQDSDVTIIEDYDDHDADPDFDAEEYVKTIKAEKVKTEKTTLTTTCSTCGKEYGTRRAWRRHVATAHIEGKAICDYCGNTYKGQDTLKRHIRAIHKDEKHYKCTIEGCEERFHFHNSLKLHILRHTGERPHVCSVCFKSYLTSHHLKVHFQAVHGDNKSFICRFCGKGFSYSTSHKMHERTHSGKKERPFPCEHCGKTFVNRQALKYHVAAKHTVGGNHQCEVCHKVYKTEFILKVHQRRHTEANQRFMCDICGKQFMYKSTLELHKSVHVDDKNFECQTCGKCFKTYPTLYSHQLVHKDDNPFECSVCKKAFKTKERCKAHERRHSGLKPFMCAQCHHCFPDKGGLQKHLKTVHVAVKKFVCDICGKATSRADNLRVHMKVHAKPGYEPKIGRAGKRETSTNRFDSRAAVDTIKKTGYVENSIERDVLDDSNSSDMLFINTDANNFTTLNAGTVGSQSNKKAHLSNINADSPDPSRNQYVSSESPVNLPVQVMQSHDSPSNSAAPHNIPMPALQPAMMYHWPYVYQAGMQPNQTGSNSYFP